MSLELQHVFGNNLYNKCLRNVIVPLDANPNEEYNPSTLRFAFPCGSQLFAITASLQLDFTESYTQGILDGVAHSLPTQLSPPGICNYQEISCVAHTDNLIALGMKGELADIILLEKLEGEGSLSVRCRFEEHDKEIVAMAFTVDDGYLVSVGSVRDQMIFVWSCAYGSEGNILASLSLKSVPSQFRNTITQLLNMGYLRDVKGRDTNILQVASVSSSGIVLWDIDEKSQTILPSPIGASGKQVRVYECLAEGAGSNVLYAGTQSSDIAVVLMKTRVIQEYVPSLASGGVLSLLFLRETSNLLLSGNGDGSVTIFEALMVQLIPMAHIEIEDTFAITSLCCTKLKGVHAVDSSETPSLVLCGTSNGSIHFLRVPDRTNHLKTNSKLASSSPTVLPHSGLRPSETATKGFISKNPSSPLTAVAYPNCRKLSVQFSAASSNGEAYIFSLEKGYELIKRMSVRSTLTSNIGSATAIAWISSMGVLMVGHEDSRLRLWGVYDLVI